VLLWPVVLDASAAQPPTETSGATIALKDLVTSRPIGFRGDRADGCECLARAMAGNP
jgi:hypothetical protein